MEKKGGGQHTIPGRHTFSSVVVNRLVHDMRSRGVLREYTNWIVCKVSG